MYECMSRLFPFRHHVIKDLMQPTLCQGNIPPSRHAHSRHHINTPLIHDGIFTETHFDHLEMATLAHARSNDFQRKHHNPQPAQLTSLDDSSSVQQDGKILQ